MTDTDYYSDIRYYRPSNCEAGICDHFTHCDSETCRQGMNEYSETGFCDKCVALAGESKDTSSESTVEISGSL